MLDPRVSTPITTLSEYRRISPIAATEWEGLPLRHRESILSTKPRNMGQARATGATGTLSMIAQPGHHGRDAAASTIYPSLRLNWISGWHHPARRSGR